MYYKMKYSKSENLNYKHLSLYLLNVMYKIILNLHDLGYANDAIDSFDRENRCP